VNITCVNALAFVGGIGLAAAMQSLEYPARWSHNGRRAKMQLAVYADTSVEHTVGVRPRSPLSRTHWVKQTQYTDANDGVAAETTSSARRYES